MPTALDTIANLTGAGITEAQAKTWFTAMRAALAEMGDPMGTYGVIQNLSVVCSVGSSALTIALKDRAGSDPSAASPVSFPFRNVTVATGDFSVLNLTAAHSLVISSGSTMGAVSATPFRLWLVEFNDGGTLRLGAINCLSTAAGAGAGRNVTAIHPLKDDVVGSSTAEGGAGAADSAQVVYTGTAVTSKARRVLGYLEWASGLTTAGTWDAVPTKIQLFGPGVPLPGQPVQFARNDTGAVATGTTTVPSDDTIPQNTEGDQYMTQAITPTGTANVLEVVAQGCYGVSTSGNMLVQGLFQDSTANALAVAGVGNAAVTGNMPMTVRTAITLLAATVSATTFKTRTGPVSAATVTFNGNGGAREFGGVANSFMEVRELMG